MEEGKSSTPRLHSSLNFSFKSKIKSLPIRNKFPAKENFGKFVAHKRKKSQQILHFSDPPLPNSPLDLLLTGKKC